MTMLDARVRVPARGVAAALALCSLLAACGGFTRPSPVRHTFLLDTPALTAVAPTPKPMTLRVAPFTVAAPFRSKEFVLRTGDLAYESDYYDQFFVPPGPMLTDATARALAGAGVFARVAPASSGNDEGDYVLRGFVSDLYADTRAAGGGAAVLGIDFYLTPGAASTSVIWNRHYEQRVGIQGSGPDAIAHAWNAALAQVLAGLARDLATATLPAPAPSP